MASILRRAANACSSINYLFNTGKHAPAAGTQFPSISVKWKQTGFIEQQHAALFHASRSSIAVPAIPASRTNTLSRKWPDLFKSDVPTNLEAILERNGAYAVAEGLLEDLELRLRREPDALLDANERRAL